MANLKTSPISRSLISSIQGIRLPASLSQIRMCLTQHLFLLLHTCNLRSHGHLHGGPPEYDNQPRICDFKVSFSHTNHSSEDEYKINGSWFYHQLTRTRVTEPTALLCSPLICLELATSALRADLNPCTKSLYFQQKAADYKSVKVLALKGIFSITTQVFIVMTEFSTSRYIIRTQ